MKKKDSIQLFGGSYGFAYDETNKRFLICFLQSQIYIMDVKDNNKFEYSNTIDLKDHNVAPTSIRISNKGEIFLTCIKTDTVYIFNNVFKLLRKIVNTAKDCFGLAINDDGSEVYVSSNNRNIIQKFDALNCSLIYEVVISRPFKIALKGGKLYATSLENLVVLDSKDGSVIENILIEKEAHVDTVYIKNSNNPLVVSNNNCKDESKYLYSLKRTSNNYYSIDKISLCEAGMVSELLQIGEDLFILAKEEEHDYFLHRITY